MGIEMGKQREGLAGMLQNYKYEGNRRDYLAPNKRFDLSAEELRSYEQANRAQLAREAEYEQAYREIERREAERWKELQRENLRLLEMRQQRDLQQLEMTQQRGLFYPLLDIQRQSLAQLAGAFAVPKLAPEPEREPKREAEPNKNTEAYSTAPRKIDL
jgi:hypothetical protein